MAREDLYTDYLHISPAKASGDESTLPAAFQSEETRHWLIRRRHDAAVIGSVSTRIDPASASARCHVWVVPKARGMGIGSEALVRVIEALFAERLCEVVAMQAETPEARRFLTRAGLYPLRLRGEADLDSGQFRLSRAIWMAERIPDRAPESEPEAALAP